MSKQVMQSITDGSGKSRQTVKSSQPVWMSHWMRTSSNATAERREDGAYGNKELDRVSKDDRVEMGTSRSTRDPIKLVVDTENHKMSSNGSINEGTCSAQMKHCGRNDEIHARRRVIDQNHGFGRAFSSKGGIQLSSGVLAANEKSSREYCFNSEGTSKKPSEWVKRHFSAKEKTSSTLMPSHERSLAPSTHIVPYHDLERSKIDKGKAVVCASISRPSIVSNNQLPDIKLKMIEQEHSQKHFQSANIISGRKRADCSEPDTLTDDHHQSKPGQGWYQMMQKYSHVTSFLPSQCIAPEKSGQKVLCTDCYPIQKFPNCVHETMKICTTVDSVEAAPGGCPWFSQTTRSLLITKKTDVNVSKETDSFRRLVTQINGTSSSDLENILPFCGQANRGVRLQPISSSNSEGQRDVGDFSIGTSKAASKNESSAETDTLLMDFTKEGRPNSGVNSKHSTKVFNFDNNPSLWNNGSSSREVGRRRTSSEMPDINLELPALPGVPNSSEGIPTSSRTQSLEMDLPLFRAEQPEPKLNLPWDEDPTIRWVKRLKSSSDSSGRGTKSLNMAENSSHVKKKERSRSIFQKGITSSIPTPKIHSGRDTILSDGSGNSSKVVDEHLLLDPTKKKSKDLLLSHTWIKRWLCNESRDSQKIPKTPVVCEPQCLKSSVGDLQKKQFPSVAAIALMGKSMNGFQSCELRKRGSLTVWNTKAF